jgi:class 3 adenylate cyclase/tetratricopeptide (TPR) repeat protein
MDVVACPSCREENPAKFRLCGFCGTPLAPPPETVVCPSCGEENPGRFRLCGFCGTTLGTTTAPAPPPLAAVPAELGASEVRKPATFIFVDLKGSTALTERIDQEAMSEIKKRYFTVMAAQIERHGGTIEKYIGDAIMAVFGIPRAHEDDALRAVRAAHGMQRELTNLNADFQRFYGVELANRTGVNTGEVVANTDPTANQQLATGDTVNVAARLEQAAPANEILIGETTYDLVRSWVDVEAVEPLELKGKSERVPAFRLISVREVSAVHGAGTLQEAPLVGRVAEIATLEASLESATEASRCGSVTVIGDPGVGKSRLVREFTVRHGADTRVLRGRCLPYGDGITFWPLAEITREAAGIEEEDPPAIALEKIERMTAPAGDDGPAIAERIAAAIGLSPASFPVTELFWGARRLLETLAREQPVLAIVDDIHFAQPTFLSLIEHLVTAMVDAPVLLLTTARHALIEDHPDWGDRSAGPVIELGPLGVEESGGLVDHLLGGTELDATTRSRVVSAADGNPLFVEQMVSMLVDKGLLRRVDGRWQPARELADVAVPPTIQALLASRLDDLSREERAVVEPASVIGQVFFEPAVEEMVPGPVRPAVATHLGSLDRKQFIARDDTDPEEETYRFRHGLIREATYGSLLKRTRAQLHERFVTWAERVNRERGREQEFEEILGFHLEQSYRYRTELGPLDDAGRELARRAAEKLGNAGRRAFARGDLPAASSLLQRASALLERDDPTGIEMRIDLAEAYSESGRFADGIAVLDELDASPSTVGDPRIAARSWMVRLGISMLTEELGEGGLAGAEAQASQALDVFQATGDIAGAARATRVIGALHSFAGRFSEAAEASHLAVTLANDASERRLASRAAAMYANFALAGPTPVSEARERFVQLLEQVKGDRKAEATIHATLAVAEAMLADFDAARERYRLARSIFHELGPSVLLASTSIEGARIEMLASDHAAAERLLRDDDAALAELGESYFRSTVAGLLANVLEAQGRDAEALDAAALGQELADEEDFYSQALCQAARAKVLAKRGEAEEAISLIEGAATTADGTSDLDFRGDMHADFGLVLSRLGRPEARMEWEMAARLYAEKGDVVGSQAIRERLQDAD